MPADTDQPSGSAVTLDEALQSTKTDVERIVKMSEPKPVNLLVVAGQIALGVVFPWVGPKSSD